MGKRSLQQKAGARVGMGKAGKASTLESGIKKNGPLHRGRRKRLEAKERAASKRTFIEEEVAKLEALATKKREAVRRERLVKSVGNALAVLPDLAGALPDVNNGAKMKDSNGANHENGKSNRMLGGKHGLKHRSWSKVVDKESEQLSRVQNHEAVREMGIEALRAHLANTVRVDANKDQNRTNGRKGSVNDRATRNGRVKKTGKRDGNGKKDDDETGDMVAANRREDKRKMAKMAASLTAKRRGQVQKQTMKSLLSGQRGRIGEKREKIV